jgi:hypothetical protein
VVVYLQMDIYNRRTLRIGSSSRIMTFIREEAC